MSMRGCRPRRSTLGPDVTFLSPEESTKADAVNMVIMERVWNLWKLRVQTLLGK